MLLILRINVRIDEVLDILLSRAEPQERETFARMDEDSGGAFRLSVLLCECSRSSMTTSTAAEILADRRAFVPCSREREKASVRPSNPFLFPLQQDSGAGCPEDSNMSSNREDA